jgi:hypothetical protein
MAMTNIKHAIISALVHMATAIGGHGWNRRLLGRYKALNVDDASPRNTTRQLFELCNLAGLLMR